MDQFKKIFKTVIENAIPYKYEFEGDHTPMTILSNWDNSTNMDKISIGMLKDWFDELVELENEMIDFYKQNNKHGTL